MRESNHNSVVHNRASVALTAALYDRRALDAPCPSKPLLASLTHLVYLTSTSPKIRDILTLDGGLERLVSLVHHALDCADPSSLSSLPRLDPFPPFDVHSTTQQTRVQAIKALDRPLLHAYALSLQCLVNVGVRGSETVRVKLVASGILSLVARILRGHLDSRSSSARPFSGLPPPYSLDSEKSTNTSPIPANSSSFMSWSDYQNSRHILDGMDLDQDPFSSSADPLEPTQDPAPILIPIPSSSLLSEMCYREEDILLCLQLLAYLSKYPHVRAAFHDPRDDHPPLQNLSRPIVRKLSCSKQPAADHRPIAPLPTCDSTHTRQLVENCFGSTHKNYHHSRTHMSPKNIFTLVEKFTFRPGYSRSPSSSSLNSSPVPRDPLTRSGNESLNLSQNSDEVTTPLATPSARRAAPVAATPTADVEISLNNDLQRDVDRADREPRDGHLRLHSIPVPSTADSQAALTSPTSVAPRPANLSYTPSRLSNDIQYWAGVIMRNACRKDETRGGIRQCANMSCGVWEAFAREFAKCRRCRKAKYCSKRCQSAAWADGHRFWCSAREEQSVSDSAANQPSHTNTSQADSRRVEQHQQPSFTNAVPVVHVASPLPIPISSQSRMPRHESRERTINMHTTTVHADSSMNVITSPNPGPDLVVTNEHNEGDDTNHNHTILGLHMQSDDAHITTTSENENAQEPNDDSSSSSERGRKGKGIDRSDVLSRISSIRRPGSSSSSVTSSAPSVNALEQSPPSQSRSSSRLGTSSGSGGTFGDSFMDTPENMSSSPSAPDAFVQNNSEFLTKQHASEDEEMNGTETSSSVSWTGETPKVRPVNMHKAPASTCQTSSPVDRKIAGGERKMRMHTDHHHHHHHHHRHHLHHHHDSGRSEPSQQLHSVQTFGLGLGIGLGMEESVLTSRMPSASPSSASSSVSPSPTGANDFPEAYSADSVESDYVDDNMMVVV